MPRRNRTLVGLTLLATACASTSVSHSYKEFGKDVMESEIQPFVELVLPGELKKSAADADFEKIRSGALRIAALFGETSNASSTLYLSFASDRKAGVAAAQWFKELSTAATGKQHERLAELFKQKPKICTGCHDEY